MLQRLRNRAQGEEGFTLIELLVVILIIGILAAVAIPTFLSQTSKAYDSNVQSSINSAQTAMETYNTSNGGYPTTTVSGVATTNPLLTIEPTLKTAFNTVANSGYAMTITPEATTPASYTVVAEDSKAQGGAIWFDMNYTPSTGAVIRTCQNSATPATTATTGNSATYNRGSCSATGTWGN